MDDDHDDVREKIFWWVYLSEIEESFVRLSKGNEGRNSFTKHARLPWGEYRLGS